MPKSMSERERDKDLGFLGFMKKIPIQKDTKKEIGREKERATR